MANNSTNVNKTSN